MKNKLLFITFLCFSLSSFAQSKSSRALNTGEGSNKGWVSVSLGLAIPMFDYGSTSIFNQNSGLAKLGFGCNVDYALPFNPYVGAIFSANAFINQCDEDAIKSVFKMFGSPTPDVSMTSWKAGSALAGFYAKSVSSNGRPTVYAKLQLGYALTGSPEMTLTQTYNQQYSYSHQSSGIGGAWVFNGGAGLSIPLASGPNVQFGINYITMKSDFKDVEAESVERSGNAPAQTTTRKGNFSMTYSNLMVQLGLAWGLH